MTVTRAWSSLKIDSYEKKLITLNANPRNQWVGDAAVLRDGCRRVITVAGDNGYSETGVADAAYVIVREADGSYTLPKGPALFYPAPSSGVAINYLGAGMGSCMAHGMFYAVVGVANMIAGKEWVSLAVSGDGLNWQFVSRDMQLTDDPLNSWRFMLDGSYQVTPTATRLWHVVMEFNPIDDHFYVAVGLASPTGEITSAWYRFEFGKWNVESLGNGPVDVVDPMCLTRVDDETWLFLYSVDFGLIPKITYRIGLPMNWDEPKILDLTPVLKDGWVVPCATRNAPHSLGLALEDWRDGRPVFLGYLAMGTKDMCSTNNQQDFLSSNGLVPLKIVGV